MVASTTDSDPVIEHQAQLVDDIAAGSKPKSKWRIGTEHEKFGFRLDDLSPLPYEGGAGIRAILEGLTRFGWTAITENELPVALAKPDGSSVSLEPGGQLELSGAPLENIHQTCAEVGGHLNEVKAVAEPLGVGFLGVGFHPSCRRDQMPWMPKARYRLMRAYMPKVGSLGLDMMVRTCTVQVNLDYSSEADMVRKFRVSLALQPIATLLFANSPFTEGKPNGYLSYRAHVWTDTDPDRSGMLPFVFESGMGFERWVDYMLDVPMYFVRRDGRYLDATGQSFRDFLAGALPALPGVKPRLSDWCDHLTTAFPEVRLKTFLEMRGADGGPWRRLCALPAFWAGLLYDQGALDAAWDLVRDWTAVEREQLRRDVPRLGFRATINGVSLDRIARRVMEISSAGLHARGCLNAAGDDESGFLSPLWQVVRSGQTPAERKLALYHDVWGGSVEPLFREFAY